MAILFRFSEDGVFLFARVTEAGGVGSLARGAAPLYHRGQAKTQPQ